MHWCRLEHVRLRDFRCDCGPLAEPHGPRSEHRRSVWSSPTRERRGQNGGPGRPSPARAGDRPVITSSAPSVASRSPPSRHAGADPSVGRTISKPAWSRCACTINPPTSVHDWRGKAEASSASRGQGSERSEPPTLSSQSGRLVTGADPSGAGERRSARAWTSAPPGQSRT